jgi:hypothetical protein
MKVKFFAKCEVSMDKHVGAFEMKDGRIYDTDYEDVT